MNNEITGKLKLYRTISLLIVVLGILLLVYMIKVEDELGALPLLLIIVGIVFFIRNNFQIRKVLNK